MPSLQFVARASCPRARLSVGVPCFSRGELDFSPAKDRPILKWSSSFRRGPDEESAVSLRGAGILPASFFPHLFPPFVILAKLASRWEPLRLSVGAPAFMRARSVYPEPRRELASAEWVTRHHFSNRYPKLLETRVTQTKQITETVSNPEKIGPFPNAIYRFLIDTPKRLETSVTQTKQTSEVISNRYKNRGVLTSNVTPKLPRTLRSDLSGSPAASLYFVVTSAGVESASRTLRSRTARVSGFGSSTAPGSSSSRCVEPV